MVEVLREMAARGVTVFISTHILGIAERICDRVGIFNQGRLVALGAMDELRSAKTSTLEGTHPTENSPRSLEEIFFELTGDYEERDLAEYLD